MALARGNVSLVKINESQLTERCKLLWHHMRQLITGENQHLKVGKGTKIGDAIDFSAREIQIREWSHDGLLNACETFVAEVDVGKVKFLKALQIEDFRWHNSNSILAQVESLQRLEGRERSRLNLPDEVLREIQKSQFLVIRERISRQLSNSISGRI